MRLTHHLFIILVVFLSLTSYSYAEAEVANTRATPLSLAIFPPVQFPPSDFYVRGIRLSAIMGSNRKMSGIDLGLIGNKTDQEFKGLAIAGLFNWNSGTSKIIGAQLAIGTNYNAGEGQIYGFQASLVNKSKYMDLYGVQVGLYNQARNVYGLQLGLFNRAANLHGIQIGLANFNDGGQFGVSPIINFGW